MAGGRGGKHRFFCHARVCGRQFHWRRGAGLYCSPACTKAEQKALASDTAALEAAGFEKIAANAWAKDGQHITLEGAKRIGIEKAIEDHTARVAAAAKAAAGAPGFPAAS